MSGLLRGFVKNTVSIGRQQFRNISVTSANCMKKIEVKQEKDTIEIKGQYLPSLNEPLLVKELVECRSDGKKFCPECSLGLEIKHTDVLILSQYVRPDGCMMPRRVTGLCKRQQKRIGTMVIMAHKAGLMSNFAPANSKKDPRRRKDHKKFNTYYFENTIKC